jgi:hypothetical protein
MASSPGRYRVEVKPSAAAELARIPKKVRQRIADRINTLSDLPRPPGSKKLDGEANAYRIRVVVIASSTKFKTMSFSFWSSVSPTGKMFTGISDSPRSLWC